MLRPVVFNQSLRHLVSGALHPMMTELRQRDGIALTREDGIENRLATGAGDVAEHMVKLQVHLTERLLHVKQRDPVHARRLHRHALNPVLAEPIGKCMKVAGEAAEPARRPRQYRCQPHPAPTIDLRSRFSPRFAMVFVLVAGERGPSRESLQSPDRDRCTAPKTSSLTYPLPQTHAS